MKDITRKYIEQIISLSVDQLPETTLKEAKKALIDTMGCMIAGVRSPIGKTALDVFGSMGGAGEATVYGDGRKMPAPIAAYVTGQCSVGPDLSDNYKPGSIIISHPGEAVIPSVLALGEKEEKSLSNVLLAIIVGYETAGRYALAIEPRRPEVYSFSTHYTIAAGVACAKLLGYEVEKSINALGIAGTLAPLPVTMPMWGFREEQRPASWHRDMPGHSNFAAVTATLFADTDFRASSLLLEEDTKYYKIGGSDHYDPEKLFENWSKGWVVDTITYKAIPSCYFNQPCIEAARLLIEENDIKVDDIKKIELYAPINLAKNFIYYPPKTPVDTASSVKYLTAMSILTRHPDASWYLDFSSYLESQEYKTIADKITVFEDKKLQKILEKNGELYGKAKIETRAGVYEKMVDVVKGSYENPFSMEEIENKFLCLCEPVIGGKKAKSFLKKTRDIDLNTNIRNIISILH